MMEPDVWSEGAWDRDEAASRLGISVTLFDRIQRATPFPARWIGAKKVFARLAVLSYLTAQPVTPPEGVRNRLVKLNAGKGG